MYRLHKSRCAICNIEDNFTELYPANFDMESFNSRVFSARRIPDRIHYRIVRCNTCGLVRSDPVAEQELLLELYRNSSFDYAQETANLRLTYNRYLSKLEAYGAGKNSFLEIGCGNGFFLEEALRQGYVDVCGVEPSRMAVAKANPLIRKFIICDVMRTGVFNKNEFDVICLFQVLDHIADPISLLVECYKILKSGGLILCINHNIEAVSMRILKERSPIIDIEHTYLYSPVTLRRIFSICKFEIKKTGPVFNRYSIRYLTQLLPLLKMPKHILLSFLEKKCIGQISFSVPLGNIYLIAKKPAI